MSRSADDDWRHLSPGETFLIKASPMSRYIPVRVRVSPMSRYIRHPIKYSAKRVPVAYKILVAQDCYNRPNAVSRQSNRIIGDLEKHSV